MEEAGTEAGTVDFNSAAHYNEGKAMKLTTTIG